MFLMIQDFISVGYARLGNRELAIEAGRRATEILPISIFCVNLTKMR